MGMNYDYDEEAAGHADDFVNRIDQSGSYIGQFIQASALVTKNGGHGIHFEFEVTGGTTVGFDIYTQAADGTKWGGYNQLQAIQTILGIKGLHSKAGKVQGWVDGKRGEVDGEYFPDLLNKRIGVVLQREDYTNNSGKDSYRMLLQGQFHAETRLTASEIRERKTEPKKLEKMMRGLKNKDSRMKKDVEPSQPAIGADAGSY